jgi:Ca2+-binding RTX toxin-like protein
MTGNSGNNLIDGGLGADHMAGGAGNDIYYVENAGDTVTEASGEGTDTVRSSLSYTLGANLENLTLMGSDSIDGTGNELNNTITGNSGDNVIDGGAGADKMLGGAGDDTYYVDNVGDLITEGAGAGTDTVNSSITYKLAANVENLTLTGAAAINGTGNGSDNVITGNDANNILTGGGGADHLSGGDGSDSLKGGDGADTFVFDSLLGPTNFDKISDFSAAEDSISLSQSIFTEIAEGVLSASAFVIGTSAHDADDRIIYDQATGKIYYDADGNGGGAKVLFAKVTAGTALTNSHFTVVADGPSPFSIVDHHDDSGYFLF